MKKIIFFILLNFSFLNIQAQNLTMAEILKLQKLNLAEAEEYLIAKKWNFFTVESKNDYFKSISFAYDKNEWSDQALAFLSLAYYENTNELYRIYVQIHDQNKYLEYVNAIKAYKCKLISTNVDENGEIIKVYRGATSTFKIISGFATDNNHKTKDSQWTFHIYQNKIYDLITEEKD